MWQCDPYEPFEERDKEAGEHVMGVRSCILFEALDVMVQQNLEFEAN